MYPTQGHRNPVSWGKIAIYCLYSKDYTSVINIAIVKVGSLCQGCCIKFSGLTANMTLPSARPAAKE